MYAFFVYCFEISQQGYDELLSNARASKQVEMIAKDPGNQNQINLRNNTMLFIVSYSCKISIYDDKTLTLTLTLQNDFHLRSLQSSSHVHCPRNIRS